MKTIAFCCLHYGAPYLADSIRSVIDAVDQYVVVYTPVGSHGTRSDMPCPDTRDALVDIARRAAGDKLVWREGVFNTEGQHRESVLAFVPDADIILVVDSDEVWLPEQRDTLLAAAAVGDATHYLAYEMPFWRSFQRAVPDRLCAPVRAINVHGEAGDRVTDTFFAHFGYAQPTNYIEYKMRLHGHRADWRSDWFALKWLLNAQEDVHPTNHNFWNARAVNPLDYVPAWMTAHSLFGREVIP